MILNMVQLSVPGSILNFYKFYLVTYLLIMTGNDNRHQSVAYTGFYHGRGSARPERPKAGWDFGGAAASPLPTSGGLKERCKLPQRPPNGCPIFYVHWMSSYLAF